MTDRIADGVVRLGLGVAQAYLVTLADGTHLVDTGTPGNGGRILAALAAAAGDGAALRSIVLTHQHRDHAGSVAAVARATGAPVAVHVADAAPVRDGLVPAIGRMDGPLGGLLGRLTPSLPLEATPVARELGDGDRVGGDGGLRVVHTPGHTPGHVSLLLERDGGVLFVGDAAANLFGRLGRPFVATDREAVAASLARIAGLDFEVAVFGHGRAIRGGAAARFRRLAERHATQAR